MKQSIKRYLCSLLALVMLMCLAPAANAANDWNSDALTVCWNALPVYDGTAKEPRPVVAWQGQVLTEGRDYTLTYSNNVNSGNQAQVQITGMGQYEACSKTAEFVILPAEIGNCRMEFGPAVYCGVPVTPAVYSICDSEGNVLEENVDYLLMHSENVQPGEAKVRVIGLGNYTGYADCSFSITTGDGVITSGDHYVDLPADQSLSGTALYLEEGSNLVLVLEGSPNIRELNVNGKPHPDFDPDALELYYFDIQPGCYTFAYTYLDESRNSQSVSFTVYVIRNTPASAHRLIPGEPVRQGSRNLYLRVQGQEETEMVSGPVWSSLEPENARTTPEGVALLKRADAAMFQVEAGGLNASFGMDVEPLDLSEEGRLLNYNHASGTALVTWENEVLTQDVDYYVTALETDGITVVVVEGMNLFTGVLSGGYYPLECSHSYSDVWDADCDVCSETRKLMHVQVEKLPEKLTYSRGEKLDLTGGTLTVIYDEGTRYPVPMTEEVVLGSTDMSGEAVVSICYRKNGQDVIEEGFRIQVTTEEVKQVACRIFGADRYATAFKAADTLKEELGVSKFQNVIVASGTGFADALAGSYLAAVKDAPILLVRAANVNAVKDYIKANLASGGTVYLLGGVNAVPKTMETGLDGFNVMRLGGANRYDTNLLILQEAGVGNKDIIVCTGKNFADSLSASAVGLPILLVKDGLYANQKEFLKSISGNIIIVGGTNAVNTTVEKQLASYGNVTRLAGSNRYETSVQVAKRFFDNPSSIVLAYAQNFPDGLSGGPLAYVLKAPLILTDNNKPAAAKQYADAYDVTGAYVMGGTSLISDKVAKNIFSIAA